MKHEGFEEDDDGLEIRFVNDIESLVPPRYNPDTRTYFKCSIYSPSNRLYTVNEEVNSTYSDAGHNGEGFSSSARNSAYRITHGKTRIPSHSQKKGKSGEFAMRGNSSNEKGGEDRYQIMSAISITEEHEDEDLCDVSENMILP